MIPIKIFNDTNRFVVDWTLNTLCTYHCSYCPDMLHRGVNVFKSKQEDPIIIHNFLTNLADKLKGRSVHIFLNGGEPTISPSLETIIDFCNEKKWCLYVNTNGSRSLDWWKDYAKKIYKVTISYHPESVDDSIFEKVEYIGTQTNVGVFTLMYPPFWDKSVTAFERFKSVPDITLEPSRVFKRDELAHDKSYEYSAEQLAWLEVNSGLGIRGTSFAPDEHNYYGQTFIEYSNGEIEKFDEVECVNNLKNIFTGWTCTMGSNHIYIDPFGTIKHSACNQARSLGNFENFDFAEPQICQVKYCTCTNDVLIPKIKQ
jgi:MoaA/NifB/PqqE/SkfB family radical SAM enzyme